MKRKSVISALLIIFAVMIVSGCETVPKKFKAEVQDIKTRVDTLETRVETVETKQAEASARATGAEMMGAEEEAGVAQAKTNICTKPRAGKGTERTKEIQGCLKNAGFYKGAVDGIKGKKTRKAIKEFQKANGLAADGVVGKNTWELLGKYAQGPVSGEASK